MAGEGCSAPGSEGWSLWGPFGPAQQPLCNAMPMTVSLSPPCPGTGCSLLLQFLTAICGQARGGTLSLLHQPRTHNPINNIIKLL